MTYRLLLSACIFFATDYARADVLFNVDFESPTYTNGQVVAGGAGPHEPTYSNGGVVVSDGVTGLGSQAALLSGPVGSMTFWPDSGSFNSGIHLISWEMSTPGNSSGGGVTIAGDAGSLFYLFLRNVDGFEEIVHSGTGATYPGVIFPIDTGRSYGISMLINLDEDYLDFFIDGVLREDNYSLGANATLTYADFYQSNASIQQFGVDNFKWETIPEPSSLLLILCGGAMLLPRRFKRR
jgi:hypothetical protein